MKKPNVRYQNQGDYQLPCITTKEQNELHIGVWANRHRQYLKQHHRIRYYNLTCNMRPRGEVSGTINICEPSSSSNPQFWITTSRLPMLVMVTPI